MSAQTTNITDYKIDGYEYFINVEKIPVKPKTIKAYIPKYMPKVVQGNWKKPCPITVGTILNAPECSVTPPNTVMEQGYITLGHYENEHPDFSSKATKVNGALVVMPGNKFMAEVLYNDPTDIKFTGKV